MVNAVVFDVGETLINESRQWRMWAEWLNIPEDVLFAMLGAVIERGEHHRRVFELLRPDFDLEAARKERANAGLPDSFSAADLYPDVLPCFTALRKRGLRVGIVGNQPASFAQLIEEIGVPVDFVASSAAWNVEKPAPAFFQKIISELNLAPSSIAYVGDRLDNDVIPALSAGMIAVFLKRGPWGFLHAQRQEVSKAHLRICGLNELPEALERLATHFQDDSS